MNQLLLKIMSSNYGQFIMVWRALQRTVNSICPCLRFCSHRWRLDFLNKQLSVKQARLQDDGKSCNSDGFYRPNDFSMFFYLSLFLLLSALSLHPFHYLPTSVPPAHPTCFVPWNAEHFCFIMSPEWVAMLFIAITCFRAWRGNSKTDRKG